MKRWPLALLAVLPVVGTGCGFTNNIRRNVVVTPLRAFTDVAEHHRSVQMARESFVQMAMNFQDQEFSCDYRLGYVDGFADFLDYGGFGEPPPMPPHRYSYFGNMTPEGLAKMEDWKNGFRHGAATARASNLRDLLTLPVYWGPVYPTLPPNTPNKQAELDKTQKPTVGPPPEPALKLDSKPPEQPMEPIRPQ